MIPSAVTDASCEHLRLIFASKELDGFGPQLVVVPKTGRTSLGPPIQASPEVQPSAYDGIFSSSTSGVFSEVQVDVDDCSARNVPPYGDLVIIPTDDTYISPRRQGLNHGSETVMFVDGRPGNVALMKFDLSCLPTDSIASFVLKVYAIDGSTNGGMFHVLTHDDESAWREDDATWSNAPESYNHFSQLNMVGTGTWNEVDITNALVGEYTVYMLERSFTTTHADIF